MQRIKRITARENFAAWPEVKKQLWGGELWTDGYFISTVGQQGNESEIKKHIHEQGTESQ